MKVAKALKIATGVLVGVVLVLVGVVFLTTRLERDPNELAVGAKAPAVSFLDPDGKTVDGGRLAQGKLPVLVFYRGHW